MSDKRTKWLIEAVSDTRAAQADLEKIISLLQKQNSIALEQQSLTQQQTTQTLLATQRQREAIENLNSTHSKGVTTQRTGLQALTGEYNALTKTLNGVTQLLAGAFIATSIKNYTMEVIAAKSAQDGFAVGLANMLKSKVLADQINAQLMAIAVKSPFEVEQIQSVTTKLVGMGVEVNKIIPYINMLGEISAVVGTSKLPLIAKAMLDVMNKGVLMKQELNQFAENGVPLYELLATSMEKPRKEIVKLAEAHKITFADVEKALQKATSEGGWYYGQMAAQAGTLGGQVSNLSDRYTLAKASIGDFFENGIKRNIGLMSDLIHETIGSQAAIGRLVDAVKAAVAAYVTYRAGLSTVASAKAAAAASTATLATAEVAATGATFSLTAAWNALKVAFVSNPIGALVMAVGTLITAFYTYKALTTDVTTEQNAQSDALLKSQKGFEIATKAVMQNKEGTEAYKRAVEALMATYPEYFAGISIETINNQILNGVLGAVNASFQERIRLANLAYKADGLQQKAIDLDRQQLEIVSQLRKEYAALSTTLPNDEAFIAALKKQQGVASSFQTISMGSGAFSNQMGVINNADIFNADKLIKAKKDLESELIKIEKDSAVIKKKIATDSLNTELNLLVDRLRKGEISAKQYNQMRLELTEGATKKVVEVVSEGEKKKQASKKQTLELSLENQIKELKAHEQTYETKAKLLDVEENLMIERAKRQIKSKEDEAQRILSIHKEYDTKRAELLESTIDYKMVDLKKMQEDADKELKIRNTLADDIEDLTLHMNGLILKEEEEKAARILAIGEDLYNLQKDLSGATVKLGEIQALQDAKIWQDKALVVEKYYNNIQKRALENAKKQEAIAQAEYDRTLKQYGPDNELTLGALANLTKAKTATTDATAAVGGSTMAMSKMVIEKIIEVAQAVMAIVQMLAANWIETTRAAADSLNTVTGYIDNYVDANREALQEQLSDVKLTNEEREKAIDESLNRETELVKRKSAMLAMRDQLTDVAERTESTMAMVQQGLNAVVAFAKGDFVGGILGVVEAINMAFNRAALNQIQQEMQVLREKERSAQAKIQLIEAEIAARGQALDMELKALDQEMAAFRAAQDEKSRILNQASLDQQLRLQEDDNFRRQLLESAEAREVAALAAARDRELKRAAESGATAQELADITNAFAQLIADKHNEYEDAKGNKSKEVSLATQEVKEQEKDKLNALKEEERVKSEQVENEKKRLSEEYRNFVQGAQNAIFEQQKNLAVLEIRMEIAKLKAQKRKLFANKKALDAAINEMNGLIGEITNGGGNVDDWTPGPGGGGDGTSDPNPPGGGGTGDDQGVPKFHGDTWLKRLNGEPAGRDTIKIWGNEGERIVQTHLNEKIGPHVSNEDLVETYLNYQKIAQKMPMLTLALPTNVKQLSIPESRGTAADVLNAELQREIRGLRNALKGKMTNVIINTSGPTEIEQRSADDRRTYYQKLNQ